MNPRTFHPTSKGKKLENDLPSIPPLHPHKSSSSSVEPKSSTRSSASKPRTVRSRSSALLTWDFHQRTTPDARYPPHLEGWLSRNEAAGIQEHSSLCPWLKSDTGRDSMAISPTAVCEARDRL
ncbi:hypothetical protein KM043_007860 [Ampulex compressa]|nr:hypothetical protein KM043_007860 [Ampulex compressa]